MSQAPLPCTFPVNCKL